MKCRIVNLIQGSTEWLAYRSRGLGASEWPAVIQTPGAYQTRETVLQGKLGIGKAVASERLSQLFALGHEIESATRAALNESQPDYHFVPIVCESLDHPRMFASLDGADLEKRVLLEIKSTASRKILSEVEAGAVPRIYYEQIQYQLFVTGFDRALLVVVNSSNGSRHEFAVTPDVDRFPAIVAAADQFFSEVEQRRNTAASLSDDTRAQRLRQVCGLLKALEDEAKKLEDEKKFLADQLLCAYKATSLSSDFLQIEICERAGSVDYKAIPELAGVDLERYRKAPTKFIKVTAKGDRT